MRDDYLESPVCNNYHHHYHRRHSLCPIHLISLGHVILRGDKHGLEVFGIGELVRILRQSRSELLMMGTCLHPPKFQDRMLPCESACG